MVNYYRRFLISTPGNNEMMEDSKICTTVLYTGFAVGLTVSCRLAFYSGGQYSEGDGGLLISHDM